MIKTRCKCGNEIAYHGVIPKFHICSKCGEKVNLKNIKKDVCLVKRK
ncbi:MAG: hypothetical protein ACFFDN_04830 [Candidatus Hodarchaeota archaeon]